MVTYKIFKNNLLKFFLLFLLLYPDFVIVFHTHNSKKEELKCENLCNALSNNCNGEIYKASNIPCNICEFSKYYFEKIKQVKDYFIFYYELIYLYTYNTHRLQNYLLTLNLLRSPPQLSIQG